MYVQSRRAVTQSLSTITKALKKYIQFVSIIYLIILCNSLVYGLFYDRLVVSLLIITVIYIEHINQEVYGLLLNLSKPLTANFLHFVRSAAWILFFMPISYFYPEYRTFNDLIIFWIFGSAFSLLLFLFFTRSWPWVAAKMDTSLWRWIREEFKESKTIYANNLANTTNQYYNHFLISFFLGLELTGVFVFFSQAISAMSNLLLTGVIQFAKPKMVSSYKHTKLLEFKGHFRSCIKNTATVASVMMLVAVIVMHLLVYYVVDRPLAITWLPAFYIMLVYFFLTNIKEAANLFFYSQHRDDLILKYSLYAIVINFCLSPLALYLLSLWGAVIVTVISTVIILVFYKNKIDEMLHHPKFQT